MVNKRFDIWQLILPGNRKDIQFVNLFVVSVKKKRGDCEVSLGVNETRRDTS